MTERRGIQIPVWCSAICRNAFNEKCVEECSINRDCSYFEEKPDLKVGDMPRFPDAKELVTPQEKFTAVTVYLSKIVDHLQGKEAENNVYSPKRRESNGRHNHQTEISQVRDLLANYPETISGETGKENE
jgi:hypothetical protein